MTSYAKWWAWYEEAAAELDSKLPPPPPDWLGKTCPYCRTAELELKLWESVNRRLLKCPHCGHEVDRYLGK